MSPAPDARAATADERAWIVATVWAGFHRDHRAQATRLRAAIGARLDEQVAALSEAASGEHYSEHAVAEARAASQALLGEGLSERLLHGHVGGICWKDLPNAAPRAARAAAMDLLAEALAEAHPRLADEVRSVRAGEPIDQIVALWCVWTFPQLGIEYFAATALTRLAVFGAGKDELFCVSMKIQGLM